MALAEVQKINIISRQKHQEEILETLQNLGVAQIEDNAAEELEKENLNEKISDLDYKLAGVKFSLEFLAHYDVEKKSLADKLNPKIQLNLLAIERIANKFPYSQVIKEVQEIESQINQAKSLKEKLIVELEQIKPWKALSFIPNSKIFESNFNFKFLSLPVPDYNQLSSQLKKDLPLSELEKVSEISNNKEKEILSVVFYQKISEEKINEILTEINAKILELPELEATVPERIKQINQEMGQIEDQLKDLASQAEKKSSVNQRELKIVFDYLTWQKEKLSNQAKAGRTWQTFSLIGWVDVDLIEALTQELTKITDEFTIEKLEVGEDEITPTLFRNSWAQPFEAVTDIYGSPAYSEPDPTPYLAPFFILFFALCLTDAGYGIILAVLSFLAIKLLKIPKEKQKLFKVLMYGGVATFIAGALVGGWFGITIDAIGNPAIRNLLTKIRLIDPVKDPMTMLLFSLGLGVIQVFIGLMIGIYWKVKHNRISDAIFGNGAWLYFLLTILIWGGAKANLYEAAWTIYLVYSGVGIMILTQGRKAKNPFMKIGGGILSLYGLIGYMSDILSYSRLLALGLATSIIASVINLIAGLIIELVPYVGWIIAAVVLVGGHTFNITINTLGAFIHSSRLQFVEFFPKFMEGGVGRSFKPFRRESKYVKITK